MKYCEAIKLELATEGPLFNGSAWPEEIVVDRGLLEYPQGPHVQFGRRGSLQFFAVNGRATYRRFGDVAGGWLYKLVDSALNAVVAPPPANGNAQASATQAAPPAAGKYRHNGAPEVIEAFQWLPHAVPPAALPEWFVRADFEQNKDGVITIRSRGGVVRAQPGDWITLAADKIGMRSPAIFAQSYTAL